MKNNYTKYRIIETEDGRFFPQVYGPLMGSQSWLFINEFSAKQGNPAWYTVYKYEVEPIELQEWCTDKAVAERILQAAKAFFENEDKHGTGVAVKQIYEY